MNLGNFIDIVVILYLVFNIFNGFRNGLVKSLFISFGFLIKLFVSYFVYVNFSKQLLANDMIKPIIDSIKSAILSAMPNLKIVSTAIDIIIIIFLVYLITSLILFLIFKIIKSFADSDMLGITDKMFGVLFSLIKAILVIMFLVYAFDTVSDYMLTSDVKSMLSSSVTLPRFYYYNVFMNLNINFFAMVNSVNIK